MTTRALPPSVTPASLQAWRVEHQVSQADMALLLGVVLYTYQRWEMGTSRPPAFLALALERLAQTLEPVS